MAVTSEREKSSRANPRDIYNFPPAFQEPKFARSDIEPLVSKGTETRLSPPEFRAYFRTLSSHNRTEKPEKAPDSPITEAELEAKKFPWEYSVAILTRKIRNTTQNWGLSIDESIRSGAAAIEEALDTYKESSEDRLITSFAFLIHNAILTAWEKARSAKTLGIVDLGRPKRPAVEDQKNGVKDEDLPQPTRVKAKLDEFRLDDEDRPPSRFDDMEPDKEELEAISAEALQAIQLSEDVVFLGNGRQRDNSADNTDDLSSAALYLKDIAQHPLLTPPEEIDLAQRLEAGKTAQAQLKEPSDIAPDKKLELEKQAQEGEEARQKMWVSNLRLVVSVARKYLGRGLDFLELVQEGNIGLERGIQGYNWRKGFRLSTYVYWWIRQAVSRGVIEKARLVRLPSHKVDEVSHQTKKAQELHAKFGRPATNAELAEALETNTARVEENWQAYLQPVSIETPIGNMDDDDLKLGDRFEDNSEHSDPHGKAADALLKSQVAGVLEELTARERKILRLRFGIDRDEGMPLGDIGQELGISRERVRQIEARAIRKLRRKDLRNRLGEYLEG